DGWITAIRNKSSGLINSEAKYKDHLNLQADTPADLVGTAFFFGMTRKLAEIAKILGRDSDLHRLDTLGLAIKEAFRSRFFTQDGHLTVSTQTAAVLALYFGLVPDEWKEAVLADLLHDVVVVRNIHLSTGFLGTPYLAHVLSANGRTDVAYALLNQKTYPSWLFPVTQGATTIWERWNSWTHESGFATAGTNSFNHYAFGAIVDWFYGVICGIKPLAPGFSEVLIAPQPGGKISHARAVFDSPVGRIISGWKRNGDRLSMEVVVPANTRAEIEFPTRSVENVSENGVPVRRMHEIVVQKGRARLSVLSGHYDFLVENPCCHDQLKS
ncbi:MAG: alpha-L-rhamnosidase, partial [Cupriavidus sp.]